MRERSPYGGAGRGVHTEEWVREGPIRRSGLGRDSYGGVGEGESPLEGRGVLTGTWHTGVFETLESA